MDKALSRDGKGRFLPADTQRNPGHDILGEDIGDMLMMGLGAGAVSAVSSRITQPLMTQIIPGAGDTTSLFGKAVPPTATLATTYVASEALKQVDRNVARQTRRGGVLLAVLQFVGAIVPGVGLTATVPLPASFPSLNAPKPAALPAAQAAPAAPVRVVSQMGI